MEDNVSLFETPQIDEVDNVMEEIKESVEVSKEEDKILQEIVNSNIKTAIGTYDYKVESSCYTKQEINKKFATVTDKLDDYNNDIKDVTSSIEDLEKSIKSIQEDNIENNQIILKEIESANAAISSLKQSAASMEHRQNKVFKENLKLKDKLKAMTLRMNITDTILILSIIAYTIRFLTLGM